MSSELAERIKIALENKHMTAEAASKAAKLDRTYLRKILSGAIKSPGIEKITSLAFTLDVNPQWLLFGQETDPQVTSQIPKGELAPANISAPYKDQMPKDVPVLGTAAGSHADGAFQLSTDPIDYVRRPPGLMTTQGIYGLYVEGTSMVPQFHPGDLIMVNPNKPPRRGDSVVVQTQNGESAPLEATLGVFSGQDPQLVRLQKHNPEAVLELKREWVIAIHKVADNNELFGV